MKPTRATHAARQPESEFSWPPSAKDLDNLIVWTAKDGALGVPWAEEDWVSREASKSQPAHRSTAAPRPRTSATSWILLIVLVIGLPIGFILARAEALREFRTVVPFGHSPASGVSEKAASKQSPAAVGSVGTQGNTDDPVSSIEKIETRASAINLFRSTRVAAAALPVPVPEVPAAAPSVPGTEVKAEDSPPPEPPPLATIKLDETAPVPIGELEPPPAPARASAPSPAPEDARAAAALRNDEVEIQRALDRYEHAYEQLDAKAAREVWPSVDQPALARAFEGLSSQAVDFESCRFDVAATTAMASCRGTASYVRKVGSKNPQTTNRSWTFRLRKIGTAWKIDSVNLGT